ncbi:MAG TPA: hypothetical protein VG498_23335, partial [Terriglobales bacterium]|nr:hypothetical protein [Terriglobales bacterium]
LNSSTYRKQSDETIPAEYKVPNESKRPMFLQIDFGLTRNAKGGIEPKLVELQAFPSLYAYQPVLMQQYANSFSLDSELGWFLSGLDFDTYRRLLCRAILAGHAPENVILMEIDPLEQKTLPDFLLTKELCGIETVNVLDLKKEGRKLYYEFRGQQVQVERIYNRMIVDELMRKGVKLPFDLRDDLDVEWAGHPNWYFRISKFSIPFLKHESVPQAYFLDKIAELPADRENYLLKPLYSFAGIGIKFAPTEEDIAVIPAERRHEYIIQERIAFEPVIETPHGPTQAEIRIMYIWLESDPQPTPVLTLVRMGRGKMMGVDHNRNLEWVGGSAGMWAE